MVNGIQAELKRASVSVYWDVSRKAKLTNYP